MINEETLFILEAGASCPYGYPTGKELRRIICKEFPINYKNLLDRKAYPNQDIIDDDDKIQIAQKFVDIFFKSSTPSIDLFLARNPNFLNIGRMAIALSIWESEKKSRFREDVDQNQDWYSYIYGSSLSLVGKYDIS